MKKKSKYIVVAVIVVVIIVAAFSIVFTIPKKTVTAIPSISIKVSSSTSYASVMQQISFTAYIGKK